MVEDGTRTGARKSTGSAASVAFEGMATRRRRGRPQRFPEDATRADVRQVHCEPRIAWLLATNRLLGSDPELTRRQTFLDALEARGVRVDSSSISRWESGSAPLSTRVTATYEDVLGLPEGALIAVVDGLRRALGPGTRSSARRPEHSALADTDVELLIDRAEAGEATGAHWLRLARHLGHYDQVYLRSTEWSRLCWRLVRELASAVGIGHVRRYEAAAALIQHPNARRHLTLAVGQFVTDPDVQVVGPVLSLLAEVDDPAAGSLVLRMLDAENPSLRRAASSVAAVQAARGRLGEEALPRLEAYVLGSLRRGDTLDERLDSLDLAAHLPEEAWIRVSGGLRTRRAHHLVARARSSGELVSSGEAVRVVRDLARTTQAETPAHLEHERDMMLGRLVREALLHAHKARRHHAALLLAASPYAPALARQCQRLAAGDNDLLAARAQAALMRIGMRAEPKHVVPGALAEPRETIRARALINIGLSASALRHEDAAAIAAHAVDARRPVEQRAGLFALAMTDAKQLTELADHDRLGPSAQWWLDQGPAIQDPDDPTAR